MREIEIQNIAQFVLNRLDCIKFYVSLHSYTQFFFTRWSFADVLPPDHMELVNNYPNCILNVLVMYINIF